MNLSQFYDRYASGLYAYACVLSRSPAEAEDAVQECFARLAERPGRLRNVENPQGYTLPKVDSKRRLGGLLASKAIYEYTMDLQAPLTFIDKDGRFRQPDRHLERTDLGSQPPIVQLFIPKDRYLLSVIFHDSAYAHHWTWIKGKDGLPGKAGSDGADGKDGSDGKDGQSAMADIDAIAEAVMKKIQGSIRIRVAPILTP